MCWLFRFLRSWPQTTEIIVISDQATKNQLIRYNIHGLIDYKVLEMDWDVNRSKHIAQVVMSKSKTLANHPRPQPQHYWAILPVHDLISLIKCFLFRVGRGWPHVPMLVSWPLLQTSGWQEPHHGDVLKQICQPSCRYTISYTLSNWVLTFKMGGKTLALLCHMAGSRL